MAPQTWMVPRQKYDVIHYLRETYLKADNATQYKTVDEKYLASLPRGTTLGPSRASSNRGWRWTTAESDQYVRNR